MSYLLAVAVQAGTHLGSDAFVLPAMPAAFDPRLVVRAHMG